jgi:non-ribosomal peptide synthetase component E (peptide arylation enzyme)
MILGDRDQTTATDAGYGATLDGLFRRAAVRHPNALALADPPNRETFTDGAPRQLTYAEADRIVWAIAARLRRLGLQTDAIVAMQLPNTVESVLALLGILRAGLIAAPLPLLWRKADIMAALGGVGAKMLITTSRIGDQCHTELAMQTAAELFPIRYVCAFGHNLSDGIVPLDDLLRLDKPDLLPAPARAGDPAAHIAIITWDATIDGPVPIARSHLELIAGGLAVFLEGRIAQDAAILSATPIASYAGIAVTLLPWLLSGGMLALHHPFEPESFATQRGTHRCDTVVLPSPLVARLIDAGALDSDGLKTVIALWRAPERLDASESWQSDAVLVDAAAFGEIGIVAAARGADGRTSPIDLGILGAPRSSSNAMPIVETARTSLGTLALRGAMVPVAAFPPGAERGETPHLRLSADGFADTGYPCRIERNSQTLVVTGPQPGMIGLGGYRFVRRDIDALVEGQQAGGVIAALPDSIIGQRFAGSAPDTTAVRAKLIERGVNPLIADAFRARTTANAA